jgi:predicted nucleic acid-binding protein
MTDLFRARWTDEIHHEWIRSVLENRSDLTASQLDRTRQLMNRAVPDCLVTGYEPLIQTLELPDPDDRHVLAAAIHCKAGVIVTYNLRDFPAESLCQFQIEALHPDDFIAHQFDLSPPKVAKAVRDQRAALKNPSRSVRDLLDTFLSLGLASTVSALEDMQDLL